MAYAPRVRRDAQVTKQRIFEAATAEFAAHGIAGARVDRIAAAACANKQLIYAYFLSKQDLFTAVVEDRVKRFQDNVAFDPEKLPEFAVGAYDFFVANPDIVRLGSWHALEEGQEAFPVDVIKRSWGERVRAIARAQREGKVDATLKASHLLMLILAIARAWVVATPEIKAAVSDNRRFQRQAVYEATRRLVNDA